MSARVRITPVTRSAAGVASVDQDLVAVEAPLQIVLARRGSDDEVSLGIVMRTPGDDRDLVLGLMVAEGLVDLPSDVHDVLLEDEQPQPDESGDSRPASARVTLATHVDLTTTTAMRALTRTSACGLCGRLAMQALDRGRVPRPDAPRLSPAMIATLPGRLRERQSVFDETGGLHAAALCDLTGEPWLLREDVGRHNAVDKVVGAALALGRLPAQEAVLVVSGRVAYEIVQKASAAGVPAVVAFGAPSSLAVEAARTVGLTLIGFARDGRFNLYTGAARLDA